MSAIRTVEIGDHRVELDLSAQVLGIRTESSPAVEEIRIAPTLSALKEQPAGGDEIVSISMLAQKAKLFDDGLYAAVEVAAEEGCGSFGGKMTLLKRLIASVSNFHDGASRRAAGILSAAAHLGGMKAPIVGSDDRAIKSLLHKFLSDEMLSKPIGFYTWNRKLERIFQQDRFLQQNIWGKRDIAVLVQVLHADPDSRSIYEEYLRLISRLTNPLIPDRPDLRDLIYSLDSGDLEVHDREYSFFPPSRSHEGELARRLCGSIRPPEDFNLFDELVWRIREGHLSLEPRSDSGWYDFQTWALEPFLNLKHMPESSKLRVDHGYQKYLEKLFKGILALTRETHIKQLDTLLGCSVPIAPSRYDDKILPELNVEPLYSYYLRRAASYVFIQNVLEESFGKDALGKMHRLTSEGWKRVDLGIELNELRMLFNGASVIVRRELGMSPQNCQYAVSLGACRSLDTDPAALIQSLNSDEGGDSDAAAFLKWADNGTDPDLSSDVRMMVPLFAYRGRIRVWMVLGWTWRPITVYFAERPHARILNGRRSDIQLDYGTRTLALPCPVTAEAGVGKLLNREEFRALCDRYKTCDAILRNLP